jgi:hypothetical protein
LNGTNDYAPLNSASGILSKADRSGVIVRWQLKSNPIRRLPLPPSDEGFSLSPPGLRQAIIAVSIQLTITCAVSFRAVPKILAVFQQLLLLVGLTISLPLPHFTTVIRWTLRVGMFLLTQAIHHPLGPWICILDHTIQVGTKKAFVVLKVPVTSLIRPGALTLKDVDVLSITVRDTWNGSRVYEVLHELFSRVGDPLQVVVDGGPDLQKGLKLLLTSSQHAFKVTADITHLIANLLKRKYQRHATFTSLLARLAQTKNKILQTSLAYLVPLKDRTKARFLNLPSIAKWTKQIIEYMNSCTTSSHESQATQEQIRSHFSWLFEYQEFLTQFWAEIQILSELQHLLKTLGLNDISYHKACRLVQSLPDGALQTPLAEYLKTEFEWTTHATHPSLLTSDIIESLFGKYKYLAKPHSMSEINRMIFALPCICEPITPTLVKRAFSTMTHAEMEQQCQQAISETLLSKRRKAFSSHPCEIKSSSSVLPASHEEPLGDSIVTEYHGPKTAGSPLVLTG